MTDMIKGILIAVVGAVLCNMSYNRGRNKGIQECTAVLESARSTLDIVGKKNEEES